MDKFPRKSFEASEAEELCLGATILRGSGESRDLLAGKKAVELRANDRPDVPSFSPLCGARVMKEGFFSWLLSWTGFGADGRGANFKASVLPLVAD